MQETVPVVAETVPASQMVSLEKAREHRETQWNLNADAERLRIARKNGLFSEPSVIPTPEELRAAVTLPGDTIRYRKLATDKHGLLSLSKPPKGRKNPHMTPRQQRAKAAGILAFGRVFRNRFHNLSDKAKAEGTEFKGVPVKELSAIGARAAMVGFADNKRNLRAAARKARKRQELSRKINAGTLPGNTNVRRYVN